MSTPVASSTANNLLSRVSLYGVYHLNRPSNCAELLCHQYIKFIFKSPTIFYPSRSSSFGWHSGSKARCAHLKQLLPRSFSIPQAVHPVKIKRWPQLLNLQFTPSFVACGSCEISPARAGPSTLVFRLPRNSANCSQWRTPNKTLEINTGNVTANLVFYRNQEACRRAAGYIGVQAPEEAGRQKEVGIGYPAIFVKTNNQLLSGS